MEDRTWMVANAESSRFRGWKRFTQDGQRRLWSPSEKSRRSTGFCLPWCSEANFWVAGKVFYSRTSLIPYKYFMTLEYLSHNTRDLLRVFVYTRKITQEVVWNDFFNDIQFTFIEYISVVVNTIISHVILKALAKKCQAIPVSGFKEYQSNIRFT